MDPEADVVRPGSFDSSFVKEKSIVIVGRRARFSA